MNIKILVALGIAALASCTKRPVSTINDGPVTPIPFKGEVYRSIDDGNVVTFVSSDELEMRQNGTNLICKYTKQADAFRIVANIAGTTQALYYKVIEQGLQADDGTILYSPAEHSRALEQQTSKRQQFETELLRSRQETRTITTIKLKSDLEYTSVIHDKTPEEAAITDVSVKLRFPDGKIENVLFAEMRYILRVENSRFAIAWGKGANPQRISLNLENKEEAEKVRETLRQAQYDWGQKFHVPSRFDGRIQN